MGKHADGLEPLDSLDPERHSLRVLAMFHVIPHRPLFARNEEVYFARAASGPIKIGTSCNPAGRVREIGRYTHEALELVATLPGSFERESYLHDVFAVDRIKGEWFMPSARLHALIVRAGGDVPRPFAKNIQAHNTAQEASGS